MELASLLSSHAASTPSACGFLVGVAGADGGVVPFSAVRCVHLASGALLPTPQWEREASEAASHLPLGLSLIGFYAACEPSELAKLVGEHASALRTALAPAARHAFAAVPKGGSSPPAFFTASLPSSGAGSVELKESAADADDNLSSVMIALRAAPLIHLHIKVAAAEKAGKAWAAAHAAASEAALAQLTSSRACFAFAEARHVGVVGLESGSERVAPPASGLLGSSGVKGGVQALVQGSYEYFHYMMWTGAGQKPEKYDDCGWGCAYRSLQSIISWFRLQGYTSLPNPTHYEIQKVLVDHCGQDAGTLLGKKMWLGSQDLGYYLDHTLGVECRTTTFHSGEDVAGGGRKLLHHFQTQGTPVMIGGGELAFTLLGVDFEERSGEIRFLIMDPHYQGADELGLIQPKWVGWKSAESLTHLNTKLFKADTSYNFCMPTRPNGV